ncbi:DnaD domain protein, partial [Enterococcus sp.]|uniref:DnaD domain protein n=1 Tax=Enterococcus sp. TaxID=35783 RepID=UPI003FA52BE4
MLDIQNFIGKSSSEADRKRNYRKQIEEEKKLLKGGGQMSLNCPAKTPPEIEIEIEIEIEKELEIDINKHKEKPVGDCVGKNLSLISKMYKENIGPIYPANRDWIIEVSETIDADLFKRAIEICIDRSSVSPGYLKGIIKKWTAEKIITLDDLKVK